MAVEKGKGGVRILPKCLASMEPRPPSLYFGNVQRQVVTHLDSRDPACPRGLFIDVATRRPLRWPVWVDLQDNPALESDFCAFREEPNAALARGTPLETIRYRGKARLRFIRAAPVFGRKPSDPRDLAGSLDEARRRFVEPKLLIPGEECEYPGCHRLSAYRVSDEQEIEPERDAQGRLCERAVVTRVRCYCPWHYQLPRFKSVRGVESEVPIQEGARPQ